MSLMQEVHQKKHTRCGYKVSGLVFQKKKKSFIVIILYTPFKCMHF